MAGKTESPKQTPEESVNRAIELAKKVPLPVQLALLQRASERISPTILEPALNTLIESATREKDPETLRKIGTLVPDSGEEAIQLNHRIGKGFETIAEVEKNWSLLADAGEFYQKIYGGVDLVTRVRTELERKADETDDWRLFYKAAGLCGFLQTEERKKIAGKLAELAEGSADKELLISTGRLLVKDQETREQGIKLVMAGENFYEAYKLAREHYRDINYDLRKEAEENADKTDQRFYSHRQLLEGNGSSAGQILAWLREGKPEKALKIAIYRDLVPQASKIIEEHHLQEQTENMLRDFDPARAARLANELGMSELALELAEKASEFSSLQIDALQEKIWLLQVRIANTDDEKAIEELKEEMTRKQHLLIDLYLKRNQIKAAASYAEKFGNRQLARQIRKAYLTEALKTDNYRLALDLATALREIDIAIEQNVRLDRVGEALVLAIEKEKIETVTLLVLQSENLEKVGEYRLGRVLAYLIEGKDDSEKVQQAIESIAAVLKTEYEKWGHFSKAIEMCQILGLSELADVYREINSLFPKIERGGRGSCYITTACCEVMGLDDNCEVLINLRWLRDNFIAKLSDGKDLIQLYYETAPLILERLSAKELKRLFFQAIKPASDLIKAGKHQEAFELYKATVQELSSKHLDNV